MAIRVPNLGTGSGAVGDGDNELKIRQDYNHNFSDQTNAASRLVGPAIGNVMEVGAFGLGGGGGEVALSDSEYLTLMDATGSNFNRNSVSGAIQNFYSANLYIKTYDTYALYSASAFGAGIKVTTGASAQQHVYELWTDKNATRDPNGFLKGASPIAEIYSDKMDLNHDAQQQGSITFEKLAVGDYLVKGSLGFAKEGWYIETPKDANGNVLVAVVYEQRANNDISIKTYAKKFDDETGDIVANLLKPRDIPVGRFISLRLHELPKEPPVMPTEKQPEV